MIKIALFGYSGHSFVVAEAIELLGLKIIGYYEKEEALFDPFRLKYLGDETNKNNLDLLKHPYHCFFVSIGDNKIRKKISLDLFSCEFRGATVIHPSSIISDYATIEPGTFISAGVKVNALASIGSGAILNTGCIIEHECRIGSYTHIAPGAVLTGKVKIGEGSFVGANSVIKQGVSIGKNVILGAGSVVINDIPDNVVVVGNPAKFLKQNSQ